MGTKEDTCDKPQLLYGSVKSQNYARETNIKKINKHGFFSCHDSERETWRIPLDIFKDQS